MCMINGDIKCGSKPTKLSFSYKLDWKVLYSQKAF